jgi:hypothetical protein
MKPQRTLKEMESFVLGKMDTIAFNGDYLNREDHREMGAYLLEKYKT